MTFQNLLDQIKSEARVKADDDFNEVVIALLNELFKDAVGSQRPFELRQEVALSFTDTTGFINLPTDFFIHHAIDFVDADTAKKWPLIDEDKSTEPAPRGFWGHPKKFEVVGTQIKVQPTTDLIVGDALILVYYKNPPTITAANLSTTNPIQRLEPFLIRAAVRRIRMLHSDDVQIAQMFQGDITSAAKAYVKDEALPPPVK